MASKHCASCSKFFKETFNFCPYCGQMVKEYVSNASDYEKVVSNGIEVLKQILPDCPVIEKDGLALYYGFVAVALEATGKNGMAVLRSFVDSNQEINKSNFTFLLKRFDYIRQANSRRKKELYCLNFTSKFATDLAHRFKTEMEDLGYTFQKYSLKYLIYFLYDIKRVAFGYNTVEDAIKPYPFSFDPDCCYEDNYSDNDRFIDPARPEYMYDDYYSAGNDDKENTFDTFDEYDLDYNKYNEDLDIKAVFGEMSK